MPKTKNNPYIGVRTKWSMYNDTTWMKSNRFGARALMITGILMIMTSLLFPPVTGIILAMVLPLVATAVIFIYSRKVYLEEVSQRRH